MSLIESLISALESLRANKMRTLLTMLGVIIGVGAVIAMIGIAQGARAYTLEQIQKLGANVLTVRAGQARRGGAFLGFGSVQTMKPADADAILKNCRGLVVRASPETSSVFQVKYFNRNMRTSITGSLPEYALIRNLTLAEGRFFTESEERAKARVAVIGPHGVGGAVSGRRVHRENDSDQRASLPRDWTPPVQRRHGLPQLRRPHLCSALHRHAPPDGCGACGRSQRASRFR
jgi:putative ABC transport system permease protein